MYIIFNELLPSYIVGISFRLVIYASYDFDCEVVRVYRLFFNNSILVTSNSLVSVFDTYLLFVP